MPSSVQFDPSNPLKLRKVDDEEVKGDEELLLEQDLGGNKKRSRKNIDTTQYNDDSSDDEFETNPKRAEKGNDDDDDDDDDSDSDMFSSDEEQKEDKPELKKPKVELLDLDELEKELEVDQSIARADQNEEEKDEEDVSADLEYYNNQEETHATKARFEPKLDAFNLKAEQSEGRFDADGNYIALDEPESEDEFASVKKKDIKKAKEAQLERERQELERRSQREELTTEVALESLIPLLKPVESPLEALQRLNKGKAKKRSKRIEISNEEKKKEGERSMKVTSITEYAEALIEKGFKDVYELEREELMLKYREETGRTFKVIRDEPKPEDVVIKSQEPIKLMFNEETKWEFRWLGDEQIHGPHSTNEIRYWKHNYFQSRAEIRQVGTTTFYHIDTVSI